ncbi:luciferin sulfotransferase-like [Chironomus tepperi]|uniref:luciferin sulfotransferase-like n=1 Tax=Chironomus tepperi TaxID=113505 RepID=UPI00391FBA13
MDGIQNAKDAAVSWYHHHINLHGYQGTKEDFFEAFVKDLVPYAPINEHIIDFWKIRDQPNILFLFFEDMKRNLEQEVKKTMKFLGKNYSQEEIDKLCQHLSFESVRNNKTVNKDEHLKVLMELVGQKYQPKDGFSFIRKGKIGGYKDELTDEQIEMMENYANHDGLKKIGFKYKL